MANLHGYKFVPVYNAMKNSSKEIHAQGQEKKICSKLAIKIPERRQ